jgi:hypothetical protein
LDPVEQRRRGDRERTGWEGAIARERRGRIEKCAFGMRLAGGGENPESGGGNRWMTINIF